MLIFVIFLKPSAAKQIVSFDDKDKERDTSEGRELSDFSLRMDIYAKKALKVRMGFSYQQLQKSFRSRHRDM